MVSANRIHRLILKVGGRTLLCDRDLVDSERIEELSQICNRIVNHVDKLIVIVGGAGAHYFIESARKLGASDGESDEIGISITNVVSKIFLVSMKRYVSGICPKVVSSFHEIDRALESYNCIIVGPLGVSSVSSDSVAALVAEHVCAELLLIVKQTNLFTRLPSQITQGNSGVHKVYLDDLMDIVKRTPERAGHRAILDFMALRVLQRNVFRTLIITFEALRNFIKLFEDPITEECTEIINEIQEVRGKQIIDLRKITKELVGEAERIMYEVNDPIHDVGHVSRTVLNALKLNKVYRNANKEIIEIAAWWHDTGRITGSDGHEHRSTELVGQRLRSFGLQASLVNEIEQALMFHKWSMVPKTLEGIIVRDADKLDFVSKERWMTWGKLMASGHALDFSELEVLAKLISQLDSYLLLRPSFELLRDMISDLSTAIKEIGDNRLITLIDYGLGKINMHEH